MACDHDALKSSAAAFEAGTRPVMRDGKPALQFGARMGDCVTCPPGHVTTLIHPDDGPVMDAWLDAYEAEQEARRHAA